MLVMDYLSIREEYFPGCAKKATCKLLHEYIDADSQRLIDEYPGYEVHATTIFQYKCANMNFYEKRRYNRLFQKVIHKGG